MSRRIIALTAAFVLALLGAVLVLLYARGADQRAIADAQPQPVWISTKQVAAGTTLKSAKDQGLVQQTEVAAKGLPVGALQTIDTNNQDLLALADIAPGTYLLSSAFGQTLSAQRSIPVPNGKLAVAVQLTDPQRVGNFITPGSYLTIFATYKEVKFGTSDADKQFNGLGIKGTSVILPKVQVIGMGNVTQLPAATPTAEANNAPAQSAGAQFLVTVAVTPQEALTLVHSTNNYTLYAGLQGSDVTVPPGLSTSDRTILKVAQ